MARLDIFQPLDMHNQSTWIGEIIAATPTVIAISDGFRQGDYYGHFKYKNGDIASGTVTNYNYFEGGLIQYSATELKLNAKTVENLVRSGDSFGLMKIAFKGNDIIDASSLGDTSPGEVENILWGFDGNDQIYGSGGIDLIFGQNGNDTVYGNSGDDFIVGGLGKDTLNGGEGNNIFCFDTKLGSSNVDTITDFVSGYDELVLDKNIFTSLTEGRWLSNQELVIGSKALDANDYLIFNPKTHTLSYDADGSGSGKAVAFVVLTGVTTIIAGDIFTIS